jgi:hypothetical protein
LVPEPSKISPRDGSLFRLGHHTFHGRGYTDTTTRKRNSVMADSLSFSIPIPERGATC